MERNRETHIGAERKRKKERWREIKRLK